MKNQIKKLIQRLSLFIVTFVIVISGAVGMTAFEAHVINITSAIENALSVPVKILDFGIVFPQEKLDKVFNVSLSQSFMDEERVDDVEYFIRQKPKCGLPIANTNPVEYSEFAQVSENEQGEFTCPEGFVPLPLLCPYLSKTEISQDGQAGENDSAPLSSFHGPISLADYSLETAKTFDVFGKLIKSKQDTEDKWNIDLKVPCFEGNCAQDWEEFVKGINPNANPSKYIQPKQNEHQLFGCDLWLEVSGISLSPTHGTLIVKKIIVNDSLGSKEEIDFSFTINSDDSQNFESDGENEFLLPVGDYTVLENPALGYETTYQNCENIHLSGGETEICIITNNDKAPVNLFTDGFGIGSTDGTFDEAPVWTEGASGGEKRQATTGSNSVSPEGGRFAMLFPDSDSLPGDGYICVSMNALGHHNLKLKYYWRGDNNAEDNVDTGVVEYFTGGICNAPTGLNTLATHELDNSPAGGEVWSSLQTIALPSGLNNSNFFVRFRVSSNALDEFFRIDGVSLVGTPN